MDVPMLKAPPKPLFAKPGANPTLETIEYIRNSRLSDIYAQVRDLMERRDLEMLRNIRAYCTSTARTCGVFLVGAAHRKSLIEKLRAASGTATPCIEWDLGSSQAGSG